MSITTQLAKRIRELRLEQGITLEGLADRTGVSKSNISLIERGEGNPTASVLDKLATGLGVVLAALFAVEDGPGPQWSPLSRKDQQALWTDPGSGYERRNLSPSFGVPLQLVEVHFPGDQRVAYETGVRDVDINQQVWVIEGEIHVILGNTKWELRAGDCLAMNLDQPIIFNNPNKHQCRYLVAIVTSRTRSPSRIKLDQ